MRKSSAEYRLKQETFQFLGASEASALVNSNLGNKVDQPLEDCLKRLFIRYHYLALVKAFIFSVTTFAFGAIEIALFTFGLHTLSMTDALMLIPGYLATSHFNKLASAAQAKADNYERALRDYVLHKKYS